MCEQEYDWVDKDHDIQVSTVLTEIAQCIINQSKEEGEEENKDEPQQIAVSKRKTCEATDILRRALEESRATVREYRLLHSIETSLNRLCANNSKQASISDYFKL
jgi:hypothetical protein